MDSSSGRSHGIPYQPNTNINKNMADQIKTNLTKIMEDDDPSVCEKCGSRDDTAYSDRCPFDAEMSSPGDEPFICFCCDYCRSGCAGDV